MTIPDALVSLTAAAADLLGGAAAALPGLARAAIQETAGAAATDVAAGAMAQAAARPEVALRGLRFLTGAYTVVWIILAAYLVMLSFRQRRLARQVRRIRERLGA